jgi:hypothetical protein
LALAWYNGFSPQLRMKASDWLKAEIAAGRLAPPKVCDVCGQDQGPHDYHSEDYSEPFGPHLYRHSLCWRCHLVLHSRFRSRAQFDRYRELMRAGYRFAPMPRNIGAFSAWFSGDLLRADKCSSGKEFLPRNRTLLDLIAITDARRTPRHG